MEIKRWQVYERKHTGSRVRILRQIDVLYPHTWVVYGLNGDRREIKALSNSTLDMVFKLVEGQ